MERTGIVVADAIDLGRAVRAARKRQGVRQDDLAAMVGVSHFFLGDLEKGKDTVSLGRTLKVLKELGLRVRIEPLSEAGES